MDLYNRSGVVTESQSRIQEDRIGDRTDMGRSRWSGRGRARAGLAGLRADPADAVLMAPYLSTGGEGWTRSDNRDRIRPPLSLRHVQHEDEAVPVLSAAHHHGQLPVRAHPLALGDDPAALPPMVEPRL